MDTVEAAASRLRTYDEIAAWCRAPLVVPVDPCSAAVISAAHSKETAAKAAYSSACYSVGAAAHTRSAKRGGPAHTLPSSAAAALPL